MRRVLTAAALAIVGWAPIASAQTDNARDIVVEGRPLEREAQEFTRAVTQVPSREDQLARFDNRVCAGVVGLGERQAQYIVDRIAQRALQVGLNVGEPGCKANALVLVSADATGLARAIVEDQQYLMATYGFQENLSTPGSEALEQFVGQERPVRWWHVSQTVSGDGEVLGNVATQMWGGSRQTPAIRTEVVRISPLAASRNRTGTRQDFRNVVVIVDSTRANGPRLEALADYLAMVVLAQTDPNADTSPFSTILNLFADSDDRTPSAMTDWDVAYLSGLYSAQREAPNSHRQEASIARSIRDDLTER